MCEKNGGEQQNGVKKNEERNKSSMLLLQLASGLKSSGYGPHRSFGVGLLVKHH